MASVVTLPLMEDFYTIQGEGFYQGSAAYFIRLGGCDVGCVWCDVKESWDASAHPLVSVAEMTERARKANEFWPMAAKFSCRFRQTQAISKRSTRWLREW